jgi:predicted transcriptional regulator
MNASAQPSGEAAGLTPELLSRLLRIARESRRTASAVLCEAVQEYWVRFATRQRLKPEEW